MEEDLKKLVHLSTTVGASPAFVQGGGGNTSVKINDQLMAIKASGYLLKDMKINNGFAFVNYSVIKNYINQNEQEILINTENSFSQFIKENTSEVESYPLLKPSIETGFHALFAHKYVLHTHSVYSNILCCSREGEEISKKIFPHSIWIKYANPGKQITIEIAKTLNSTSPKIVFMENHGLIVGSNSAEDLVNIHDEVNNKVIDNFSLDSHYNLTKLSLSFEQMKQKVIFPDQVVYLSSQELRNTSAGQETLFAYDFILKNINKLGLTAKFISSSDIDYIENMDSEKYRKSLIKG